MPIHCWHIAVANRSRKSGQGTNPNRGVSAIALSIGGGNDRECQPHELERTGSNTHLFSRLSSSLVFELPALVGGALSGGGFSISTSFVEIARKNAKPALVSNLAGVTHQHRW